MTTRAQPRLPRGIRVFTESRRTIPHACQWTVEGRRKTKFFHTVASRDAFASALAGDFKQNGVAAFRLDPTEAHDWRAFRAELGERTTLAAVLACWRRHGVDRPVLVVRDACALYLKAKTEKGLDPATIKHYESVFGHLSRAIGDRDVRMVTDDDLTAWVAKTGGEPWTRKTNFKRMRELFAWLKMRRLIDDDPCDGLEPPVVPEKDVVLLKLAETRELFEKNDGYRVTGRLALEAFGFLRASSAGRMTIDGLNFNRRGIRMPGAKHKSRKAKYRQGHPDNLWHWIERAAADCWEMTPRQYREEKRQAFIRAGFKEGSKNRLRKTCLSAHLAWLQNPPLTRRLAQHKQESTTEIYEGMIDEADAEAHFLIYPTGATCAWPRQL